MFGIASSTFSANQTPGALQAALAAAKAEAAASGKRAGIAKRCFDRVHSDYLELLYRRTDMNEEHYNEVLELQGQLEELRLKLSKETQRNDTLSTQVNAQAADIASKDNQIAAQSSDLDSVRDQLENSKKELQDEKAAHEETEKLLYSAYADVEGLRNDLQAAKDAKDKEAEEHKGTSEKLENLLGEWQADQEKLESFKDVEDRIHEAEQQSGELAHEVEDVTAQLQERERNIRVKNARINHLEDELQRALSGQLSAEAAVDAARSPTSEPVVLPVSFGVPSMANELASAGLDNESYFQGTGSDYDEEPEQLENVGALDHTMIDVTPIEPQNKSISASVQTDALTLTTTNTQTDIPELTTADTQTESQVLCISHITTTDIEPIKPQQQALSTFDTIVAETIPVSSELTSASIQTDDPVLRTSDISSMVTPPIAPQPVAAVAQKEGTLGISTIHEIDTAPIGTTIHKTAKAHVSPVLPIKTNNSMLHTILTVILAMLCFYYWKQLQAWEYANGYGRNAYVGTGAYGTGRYFLGVIPVGYNIGNSYFSEAIARNMAGAILAMEDWIGINRAVLS